MADTRRLPRILLATLVLAVPAAVAGLAAPVQAAVGGAVLQAAVAGAVLQAAVAGAAAPPAGAGAAAPPAAPTAAPSPAAPGAGKPATPSPPDAEAPEALPPPVPIEVTRGWLDNGRGDRLRTAVSRPRRAARAEKLPAILVVGWLSCDPVAPAQSDETDIAMLDELAARSGAMMLRVEKPGVGGSQGTVCADADFQRELAGYRAGLRLLESMPGVDPTKIFLLGISNGAAVAPLVAAGEPVAGYVVAGGWVKTWFEHMIETERRRLRLAGMTPGEVNDRLKLVAQFYDLYLNGGKTPGEVLQQRPDLAPAWEGEKDLAHQYGRPAAYFIQLQQLNIAAAWSGVRAPVLVIHGEYDWIMSREDHEMIAALVNHRQPGAARFVEVPQMDHLFGRHDSAVEAFHKLGHGELAGDVMELILDWLRVAGK